MPIPSSLVGRDPAAVVVRDQHRMAGPGECRSQAHRHLQIELAGNIPAARIKTAGYGETRPIASNSQGSGRSRNRRVVVGVR